VNRHGYGLTFIAAWRPHDTAGHLRALQPSRTRFLQTSGATAPAHRTTLLYLFLQGTTFGTSRHINTPSLLALSAFSMNMDCLCHFHYASPLDLLPSHPSLPAPPAAHTLADITFSPATTTTHLPCLLLPSVPAGLPSPLPELFCLTLPQRTRRVKTCCGMLPAPLHWFHAAIRRDTAYCTTCAHSRTHAGCACVPCDAGLRHYFLLPFLPYAPRLAFSRCRRTHAPARSSPACYIKLAHTARLLLPPRAMTLLTFRLRPPITARCAAAPQRL